MPLSIPAGTRSRRSSTSEICRSPDSSQVTSMTLRGRRRSSTAGCDHLTQELSARFALPSATARLADVRLGAPIHRTPGSSLWSEPSRRDPRRTRPRVERPQPRPPRQLHGSAPWHRPQSRSRRKSDRRRRPRRYPGSHRTARRRGKSWLRLGVPGARTIVGAPRFWVGDLVGLGELLETPFGTATPGLASGDVRGRGVGKTS